MKTRLKGSFVCFLHGIILASFMFGCSDSPESARIALAKLDKKFDFDGFISCVGGQNEQAVALFIRGGFNVNTASADGVTGLHIAAMQGNAQIVKMLLASGAKPDAADGDGGTPLMAAAAKGHLETVNLLLASGADVNAKDSNNLSAADYAGTTHLDVLKFLWQHGAPLVSETDFKKRMDKFKLALSNMAFKSLVAEESPDNCRKLIDEQMRLFQQEQGFTSSQLTDARVYAFKAISFAIRNFAQTRPFPELSKSEEQSVKTFAGFLKELQTDPAVQNSLLYIAVRNNEIRNVKRLAEQGADLNHTDGTGITFLMNAVSARENDIVQVLLDSGANINCKDGNGMTASMWAVLNNNPSALTLILAKKPDLTVTNNQGWTALMLAEKSNNAEAAVMLKGAGEQQ